MGEAEWIKSESLVRIHSDFYFYGDAVTSALAENIAADICLLYTSPSPRDS